MRRKNFLNRDGLRDGPIPSSATSAIIKQTSRVNSKEIEPQCHGARVDVEWVDRESEATAVKFVQQIAR